MTTKHPTTPKLKSAAQVNAEFARNGVSKAEWARAHKVGRRSGHYGEAHRVAVALGLKAGTEVGSAKGWRPKATAGAAA